MTGLVARDRPPYLDAMPIFPPPSSPRAALRDLRDVFRHSGKDKFVGASLAILSTIIIIILFLVDPQINTAPPQQVVYVEAYAPDRSDTDIKRDQLRDQKARDAAKEARKKEFQKLEKQLGM